MTERQIDSQSSINGVFLFLAILTAYPVRAQESGQQALSNIELEYTYSDGGAVVLKIGDGILGYRWIAGPSAGYEVTERISSTGTILKIATM
jgi:hypothetical protein